MRAHRISITAPRGPLLAALAIFAGTPLLFSGSENHTSTSEPALPSPPSQESTESKPLESVPDGSKPSGELGIRILRPELPPLYMPWTGSEPLNQFIADNREQPWMRIEFGAGTFELTQTITLSKNNQVTISGNSRTILRFPETEDPRGRTLTAIREGDVTFRVDRPEELRPLNRFQLYAPDGRGDRLLEIVIRSIEGDEITMGWPATYMPHVTEIPVGSLVVDDISFFVVDRTPNVIIEDLQMDGGNRGSIRGHTTFCGVYALGDYEIGRRPITSGLTVRGCTVKNLSGRGVAVYGLDKVLVESCHFSNIKAQAVEIDHYSRGIVRNNVMDGAEVGVMLNDAFDTLVTGNLILNCDQGIKFLEIFHEDWINTGMTIQDNRIGPNCRAGILFFGPGMNANLVRGNRYFDISQDYWVVNPENNYVEHLGTIPEDK